MRCLTEAVINMKTCYIVGAGEFFGNITKEAKDLIIAADGGYDHLVRIDIKPDLLIGDLDSITDVPKGIETVRFPVEKDETDMRIAYRIGKERGYNNFVILGGVGGREDHTFANICLLSEAKNDGSTAVLIGKDYKATVIKNEEITLCGNPYGTFSIFAFGSDVEGVSVIDAKYTAENVTLKYDFPLGVSNSFLESGCAKIKVNSGSLLIFY